MDAHGRILAQSPLYAPDVLVATVPLGSGSGTFFTRWGDWLAYARLVGAIAGGIGPLFMTKRALLFLPLTFCGTAACFGSLSCTPHQNTLLPAGNTAAQTRFETLPMTPTQAKIKAGARKQIGDSYDASYCSLSYPNGDPPAGRGACTDVVVRGLRAAGFDLQALVHADMNRHWNEYPHSYGLPRPDPNIDHRRVPNLKVFFRRHGQTLPDSVTPETLSTWQPGDVVCWKLPGGADHTGIVSDRQNAEGIPLAIHNTGICQEQDVLTVWTIAGHYRYPQ